MPIRARRLLGAIIIVGALVGMSLFAAPVASAASGGGCGNSPSTPYGYIRACINVSLPYINSDAYLNFSSIPSGCSATITLYKVIGGRGYPQYGVNVPCRKGYLGDLAVPVANVGSGTYYNASCVNYNGGGACAYSPFEYI